jgi:hypothetical protein
MSRDSLTQSQILASFSEAMLARGLVAAFFFRAAEGFWWPQRPKFAEFRQFVGSVP